MEGVVTKCASWMEVCRYDGSVSVCPVDATEVGGYKKKEKRGKGESWMEGCSAPFYSGGVWTLV